MLLEVVVVSGVSERGHFTMRNNVTPTLEVRNTSLNERVCARVFDGGLLWTAKGKMCHSKIWNLNGKLYWALGAFVCGKRLMRRLRKRKTSFFASFSFVRCVFVVLPSRWYFHTYILLTFCCCRQCLIYSICLLFGYTSLHFILCVCVFFFVCLLFVPIRIFVLAFSLVILRRSVEDAAVAHLKQKKKTSSMYELKIALSISFSKTQTCILFATNKLWIETNPIQFEPS